MTIQSSHSAAHAHAVCALANAYGALRALEGVPSEEKRAGAAILSLLQAMAALEVDMSEDPVALAELARWGIVVED